MIAVGENTIAAREKFKNPNK
jgi:hypothetical protein